MLSVSGVKLPSHVNFRFVFGVTALLPLITSAVAVLVEEQRKLEPVWDSTHSTGGLKLQETFNQSVVQLWGAVKQPNVYYPTLFVFLWQATPQSDSAMFYFTYVFGYLYNFFLGAW